MEGATGDRIDLVERGYRAVAARDRETLQSLFADDAVWRVKEGDRVIRTLEGPEAIADFLLRFQKLRLEAILSEGELVVAAHSFTRRGARVTATTLYEVPVGKVKVANCGEMKKAR
jgi:ketosteroid isomerase-like protein